MSSLAPSTNPADPATSTSGSTNPIPTASPSTTIGPAPTLCCHGFPLTPSNTTTSPSLPWPDLYASHQHTLETVWKPYLLRKKHVEEMEKLVAINDIQIGMVKGYVAFEHAMEDLKEECRKMEEAHEEMGGHGWKGLGRRGRWKGKEGKKEEGL